MLFRLGIAHVVPVLLYRLAIRFRLFEKLLRAGTSYRDPLFHELCTPPEFSGDATSRVSILEEAHKLREGSLRYFSHRFFHIGSPPDWFLNPFNGKRLSHPEIHWSKVSDFNLEIGDIKCIWEASRFDWALLLARAYRLTGETRYLTLLNEWASDWIAKNPLNMGPNWKCGQETAVRLMQVLLAAFILEQHKTPTPGLRRFVMEHCARIAPTIRYAIAQDNNHGTSEAAGLYIGGAWLLSCAQNDSNRSAKQPLPRSAKQPLPGSAKQPLPGSAKQPLPWSAKQPLRWYRLGKRWLENRVRKLIAPDGSFSQYSLNYHRVLVDTVNIVEFWRRELGLPAFSDIFYERSKAAVNWLYQMIDPETGDGPNLGANDGARLFVLSSTEYRDYRSSVQLGAVLFLGKKVYREGPWDEPLVWLGLGKSPSPDPSHQGRGINLSVGQISPPLVGGVGGGGVIRKSCIMPEGGYVIINAVTSNGKRSRGIIRFPNFRFRPGHADVLHFDLWYKGINILRDSGTYSYNADEPWQHYFSSTEAHNTVQFDGRDQMPRLGRFLFGEWLQMEQPGELLHHGDALSWTGAYTDYKKCRHKRTVLANGLVWKTIDEIEGFDTKAVLRWRLAPGAWKLDGMRCIGECAELSSYCTAPIQRFELIEGWESHYYQEKTTLPVLEIQVEPGKAVLTTEIDLKP
jgi:hypothetical protein